METTLYNYDNYVIYTKLHEPTNVAEVLTVWQVDVLGEHTVCHTEATAIVEVVLALEGVEVALALHYFHRLYAIYMVLTFLILVN